MKPNQIPENIVGIIWTRLLELWQLEHAQRLRACHNDLKRLYSRPAYYYKHFPSATHTYAISTLINGHRFMVCKANNILTIYKDEPAAI